MARDKSHEDQIERWADFVKNNPSIWKKEHKEFINSQIQMVRRFYEELSKTEEGRAKIKLLKDKHKLYKI
jgi:hypothetical protein